MPLPERKEDLVSAGYVFDNEAKCRGCGAEIEWWITPNGKKMPMSVKDVRDETKGAFAPIERTIRVPHWSDCPNAGEFRSAKRSAS